MMQRDDPLILISERTYLFRLMSMLNEILMLKNLCISAFLLNWFLQSGEAISFFERGHLFKNSTRLYHDLKLEVYAHESLGISWEHIKPLILSHYRPTW